MNSLGDLLERIAKINPNIRKAPVASPNHYGYRNKITLHGKLHNDKYSLGYYQNDNTSLIEIKNCHLACRQINSLLDKINSDKSIENALLSTLTIRYTELDGAKQWSRLDEKVDTIHSASVGGEQLLQESTSYGKFYVSRDSFFQINLFLRDTLIDETLSILKEYPTKYVFDLFCGVGVFGICAAKAGKHTVYASDIDIRAVNIAKTNAKLLRIDNIRFFAMPALKAANKMFRTVPSQKTTLILDPPRTGLNKNLTRDIATKYKPINIIYISCAADTLCRDIKILSETGYSVRNTKLIDMFPRTAHFETITLLARACL